MGERSCYSKVRRAFTTRNLLARILFAEFLGTFVLIVFGDGSVAQHILSKQASGEFISVNIAWGLAVAMGVWVSGETSGGHINPAVTFAMCIMGKCPWHQFPIYWIGQYLGAIAGAAVVYGTYYEALVDFDGGVRVTDPAFANATAGIWATYPKAYLTAQGGFGDQIVGTAMLVLCVMAITDQYNQKPHKGMVPFAVGLVVMVIGMSYGHNCGYAINPARDWGPRIFTCMAGWGTEPFSYRDYNWFWVPFVGPHVGAIIGGWIYLLFVGNHLRPDDDVSDDQSIKKSSVDVIPKPDYEGVPHVRYDPARNGPERYHYDPYMQTDGLELRGMPNGGFSTDDGYYSGSRPRADHYDRNPSSKRTSFYNAYGADRTIL